MKPVEEKKKIANWDIGTGSFCPFFFGDIGTGSLFSLIDKSVKRV